MGMLAMIETAIGITLVYLLLSLLATGFAELLLGRLGTRALILRRAINEMFHDQRGIPGAEIAAEVQRTQRSEEDVRQIALAQRAAAAEEAVRALYQTPQIAALYTGSVESTADLHWEPQQGIIAWRVVKNLGKGPPQAGPSYIDPATFSEALMQLACPQWRLLLDSPVELRAQIAAGTLPQPARGRLLALLDSCQDVAVELPERLAGWFEEVNERAGGWFKRELARVLMLIGFVIALALNADTLYLFERFNSDPALRTAALKVAEERLKPAESKPTTTADQADRAEESMQKQVSELTPFVGWDKADRIVKAWEGTHSTPFCPCDGAAWRWLGGLGWALLLKILGLLATAGAVSLGAPFWFDLLGKLVNLRSSLVPKAGTAAPAPEPDAPDAKPGQPAPAVAAVRGPAAAPGSAASRLPAAGIPAFADFDMKGLGFSLARAQVLAHLAKLAYEPDSAVLSHCVRTLKLSNCISFSTPPLSAGGHDTQGFITYNDSQLFLAFRGSEAKLDDWVTNGNAHRTSAGAGAAGQIHQGFHAAVREALDGLGILKLVVALARTRSIWISGHSLGGALAVLAAWEIDAYRHQNPAPPFGPILGVYTFGQPRVGDPGFASDFEARLPLRLHRFINFRDPVPRVPLRQMGFAEQGRVHYFDAGGRLDSSADAWQQRLAAVLITADTLKAAGAAIVGDHSMDDYERLVANSRKTA